MKVPKLALSLSLSAWLVGFGSGVVDGTTTTAYDASLITRALQKPSGGPPGQQGQNSGGGQASTADGSSSGGPPGNNGGGGGGGPPGNSGTAPAWGRYGPRTDNFEPNDDFDDEDVTKVANQDSVTIDGEGNVVCVGPGNKCGTKQNNGIGRPGGPNGEPVSAVELGVDVAPQHDNGEDEPLDPENEEEGEMEMDECEAEGMVSNGPYGCSEDVGNEEEGASPDDGSDGDGAAAFEEQAANEEEETISRRTLRRNLRGGGATSLSSSMEKEKSTQEDQDDEAGRILQTTDEGIDTYPIGLFDPLTCNPSDWSAVPCTPLTDLYPVIDSTTTITIPCGQCIEYNLPFGEESIIAGLDIHGKLFVPTNYKSTLYTPFVFVQGVLQMSDTNPISPDNTSMKIVLVGDEDVTFTPAESNANVVNGVFNAGIKPFLVAGGRLDIAGWEGGITEQTASKDTWTPVLAMAEADPPNPTLSNSIVDGWDQEFAPIDPPLNCPRQVVNHNFDTEAHHDIWSSGDGKIVHHDMNNGTIVVHGLDMDWQGFKLDFTEIAEECPLIKDAKYLVSLRLKIDLQGSQGQVMPESVRPRLQRQIMHSLSETRYSSRYIQKGSVGSVNYGEWFTFTSVWQWNEAELTDVIGQTFRLRDFPLGATIHLDDFVFELPSSKSYADPLDVCTDMIVNGSPEDLDGLNGSVSYPWTPRWPDTWSAETTYNWYTPHVAEEEGNKFYRVGPLSETYGMWQILNGGCFVSGYMYTVSARLRLHEYTGSETVNIMPYVEFRATKDTGSDESMTILTFPSMKMGDGWFTATADLPITEEMEGWSNIRLRFRADLGSSSVGKHITFDIDDVSILYKNGPAEGLAVDPVAVEHWGAGSEVHITSTTLDWKDAQDAIITEVVTKANGGKTLKLDKGINAILTEVETPGMAAEIALVSRNIKIEGETRVDYCGTDRLKQADYRGSTSVTKSGFTCQNWIAQGTHSHSYTPENYPDDGLGDHNFCRNPGKVKGAAWCYTTDPSKTWEVCDVPQCQGAYLQVLHTPNVAQKLEGVELTNMGQEKKKNRFPIQFLYTRDVAGTSISRNTIRNSAHRCIVMDGVSGATIAGNVAVETAGYCYYIGYEATENWLLNNLGSRLNTMIDGNSETLSGYDDDDRATFLIENPTNHWIGNVAAGSSQTGWYADLNTDWYGEDNKLKSRGIGATSSVYRGYPRRMPLGTFRGNKAHSNYYMGFRLYHFEQYFEQRNPVTNTVHFPVFEDTYCYRNREYGIDTYNTISAKWLGGKLSDNSRYGLRIRDSDRIELSDFDIVGSSQIFKDHTLYSNLKLCASTSWRHEGLVMPSSINRLDYRDPGRGIRLKNVSISGYDKEKTLYPNCKSTEPLGIDRPRYDGHWDFISSVENVNIDDSRGVFFDACRSYRYNSLSTPLSDVVITDVDGSLDPASSAQYGTLVHDKPHVRDILGDACMPTTKCFAYCPNVCLRTFSLKVEQFGTEGWTLLITNSDTGTSMEIPGTVYLRNVAHADYHLSGRRFSASLPAGTYTAKFIDETGAHAWPQYVEETWQKEPDCPGYATDANLIIEKPEVDESFCSELVRNGGHQSPIETSHPWFHTFGDNSAKKVVVGQGLGANGTDSFCTVKRSSKYTGPGQDLDSRCVELMKGELYELSVWMKVTLKDNPQAIATNINPNKSPDADLSPVATLNWHYYRDASTKEFYRASSDIYKTGLARPYKADDSWNLVHGIFRIPDHYRVFFEMERAPDNLDYIIDSASVTKMNCNPYNLVLNGDIEHIKTKWWDTWGSNVALDLVEGFGGSGQALKASARTHHDHGPCQWINTDCVAPGERIVFTAKIKFEVNGVADVCNPFSWAASDRCAEISLQRKWKNGTYTTSRVGEVITDDTKDGWYDIHGIFQLPAVHSVADNYSKLWFRENIENQDIIVDDVQVKVLDFQCDQLVENPSFSQGSYFWRPQAKDRQQLKLYPGAGGGDDLALRAFNRDSSWRGIRQQLDTRCFVQGEEYSIAAKFRLLNATNGEGLPCDVNDLERTGQNCPSVLLRGYYCTVGADSSNRVSQRFWNINKEWDASSFNQFETSFVVNDALSSCEEVWVYINEVDKAQEIVVDDLYISLSQTASPSESAGISTYSPTITPPTGTPTTSPTSMPTTTDVTSCPLTESLPVEIPSGSVKLARADNVCVLTKATPDVSGNLTSIAPVAVSYDGGDWEKASGSVAAELLYGQDFGNYAEGTQVYLPALTDGAKYYLTSHSHTVSEVDEVARLLEQGTFGTTAGELASFGQVYGAYSPASAEQWVKDQIAIPMTSHREFLRTRVNMRLTNPVWMGRNSHPCDAQSRWRKYTFSRKEGDDGVNNPQLFEAVLNATGSDAYITVKLNGHVRTVVSSLTFKDGSPLEFGVVYEVCNEPGEFVGGDVKLKLNGVCKSIPNPMINFYDDSAQPANMLNLPNIAEGVLESINDAISQGGDFILLNGLNDALCDELSDVMEELDAPVLGKLPDGTYMQFDPMMILETNDLDSPLPDGGGLVRTLTGMTTRCSNVPRTFLNEDSCSLSDSAMACGSAGTPNLMIELNSQNIMDFHILTGQYVYAIVGLPLRDVDNVTQPSPCTLDLRSRWEIMEDVNDCTQTPMGDLTKQTLTDMLNAKSNDPNPKLRDITFGKNKVCDEDATALVEVDMIIDGICYRRVHPEHLSVYDFSYWALDDTPGSHPGNMMAMMHGHTNPIKKWMDIDNSTILVYPAEVTSDHPHYPMLQPHPIWRWDTYSPKFPKLGRFGDEMKFVDLPNEIRLDEVAEYFGANTNVGGSGIMVCGSPFETNNDPTLGKFFQVMHRRDTDGRQNRHRENIWLHLALTAKDQLRQRVAWAFAQLLVIAQSAIGIQDDHSEAFLTYYDIFLRHAFGNYRDMLREVSFSPIMAENLSFLQSKSAAYQWETQQKISFADENFAREIMQLFSTGLEKLNLDGTIVKDEQGKPVLAYTNDEIMSFARVWTGFDYQQGRGNVEEEHSSGNRHDPMRIQATWRDKFPKTDMLGGYIGDGYPLCVDLPDKMFLRKGARYRILGASFMPELMEDHSSFKSDTTLKKFKLNSTSALYDALCNDSGSGCVWENTVTLNSSLICTDNECNADTLRVVELQGGMHYEYVRPACVEQVFFADAKKVIYRDRNEDSSCANPLLPYASEACCEGTFDIKAERYSGYLYDQERTLFSTANSRCSEMGMISCDFDSIEGLDQNYKKGYHWTIDSCAIQVKVNEVGHVAVVYEPASYEFLHPHIRADTRNYFKVYWDGDYPINNIDGNGNSCGNNTCESLANGGCLCNTEISESRVFGRMPSSVSEVFEKLSIGAYDPSAYDSDAYGEIRDENGVKAYLVTAGLFDKKTVFEVTDQYGRLFRYKNTYERVHIQGGPDFAFRNAPSFMSVLNTEADARDAYYETEAALDHYFYHDNTAPFIALRLIQRFTTSNPKPRYIKAVAEAFRSGTYAGIGQQKYGDLAATIAAVLLHPEARSSNADSDPFKGGLKEPLVRLMGLMRGLEVSPVSPVGPTSMLELLDLDGKIGQMAHTFPTVFSFFLPEYNPSGRAGEAGLVGPETMIMDMPRVVSLLNGMFSVIKHGVTRSCYGFGRHNGISGGCAGEGNFASSKAIPMFSRPWNSTITSADEQAEAVVSELATIFSSGRLGLENKLVIMDAYKSKLTDVSSTDPSGDALRLAQQLMMTAPETHTTNVVSRTGALREEPPPPTALGVDYKAIVYVMFGGGCDSYNMLVPHTCSQEIDNMTLWDEYVDIRQDIALEHGELLVLNETSNQACEHFGVHPRLGSIQKMFGEGDLLFFANTGVLTKPTNRRDYNKDTETQLFAHNHMQQAAKRIDPLKAEEGTGVLGRIRDVLSNKGLSVGAFSLTGNSIALIGSPGINDVPMILSNDGITPFNAYPSSDGMGAMIAELNGETTQQSGVFGDWFSDTLTKSLANNQQLYDTLQNVVPATGEDAFPTSSLGKQLKMVSKMIKSRVERGSDADMFYLSKGGWDTHSQVLANQVNLFGDVDASFNAFAEEMKAQGTWQHVTLVETSDFARTLNQNGNMGSDHAWGGNYIMFGGSVKGRQIVGTYPQIKDGAPLNINRGRMVPTTSWESVFKPLAEWAGVDAVEELNYVLPNRQNFPVENFSGDLATDNLFELATPTGSPVTPAPTPNPTASPNTPAPTPSPTTSPVASPI